MEIEQQENIVSNVEENPKRAIYIDREIDESLFKELARIIHQLRFESSDPITLYLDSPGGNLLYARQIWNLLKAPKQDCENTVCDIITVVHTFCGSAASYLLMHGDYIIAYPKSEIHFHGVSKTLNSSLNTEKATELSISLREINEDYAFELTKHVWNRIMEIVFSMDELESPLAAYFDFLVNKITPESYELISEARCNLNELIFLKSQMARISNKKGISLERDLKVFKVILDFKVKQAQRSNGGNNGFSFEEVIEDTRNQFRVLLDTNQDRIDSLIEERKAFLIDLYNSLTPDNPRRPFVGKGLDLEQEVTNILNEVMYYSLIFCRLLSKGENYFSAEEAWYLGLVDCVIGSKTIFEEIMYFHRIKE